MSVPERIWWLSPIAVENAEKFGRISAKDIAVLPKDGLPREMAEALRHEQWAIIDRAIERFSAGEISELHALGLIGNGFLTLDKARKQTLARWDEMEKD